MHFPMGPAALDGQRRLHTYHFTAPTGRVPSPKPHSAAWSLGKHIARVFGWELALNGQQATPGRRRGT